MGSLVPGSDYKMSVYWGVSSTTTATPTLNSVYTVAKPATLMVLNGGMQQAMASMFATAMLVSYTLY